MDNNLLVRLFGFPATLIHWDPMVLDRWRWLNVRFPHGQPRLDILDVGCGGGAFTIGLARRGHTTIGLTFDGTSHCHAVERARLCHASTASFRICDVRHLDAASDLRGRFDTVICLECIEHILDDAKLMRDMAACLKPGGRLLLTSPNADYIPITPGDAGPFWPVETGWHVRKGYTAARLHEFCAGVGLTPRHVTFCSGFLSQKLTWGLRTLGRRNHLLGWAAILPLRWIPPLIDGVVSRLTNWPGYSICLEADKPPGAPPP